MIEFLIKVKNIVLDILFPSICLLCQKSLIIVNANTNNHKYEYKKYICDNCYDSIQLNTSLFCPICRLRLAENKKICGCFIKNKIIAENGKEKIKKFSYTLAAAANYDDPIIKNLIHYFKYKSFENLAPILGEITISYFHLINLQTYELKNFLVVPIPLHKSREKQRGFNQSKLLAEYIAQKLNLKTTDILKRIKNTKPQAQCKSEKRTENVAGCFQFKNSTDAEKIKNKNILLIDDVFTSGATINEAVKILKQKNCNRIIALVIAKA